MELNEALEMRLFKISLNNSNDNFWLVILFLQCQIRRIKIPDDQTVV